MNRRSVSGSSATRSAFGDQDELVVGRDAELVDRDDARVAAALGQVDALDVAEAAEHRVGAPGEHRGQQAEADVDLLDVVERRARASARIASRKSAW